MGTTYWFCLIRSGSVCYLFRDEAYARIGGGGQKDMICIESGPKWEVRHNLVHLSSILHVRKNREFMCTGFRVLVGSIHMSANIKCMGSRPKRELRDNLVRGSSILRVCKKILYPNILLMVCILFYFKSIFSSHNWKWDPKLLYLGFEKISHEHERDT